MEPLTAWSADGRTCHLSGPLDTLLAGDLLSLGAGLPLVQVTGGGETVVVPEGRQAAEPFGPRGVRPASPEELLALQERTGATLEVGSWSLASGEHVPARLRSQGFNRHTFLCGQSGSGKTYALGVLLEQILLGTALRMVVLDPNADFIRLGEPRADAPEEAAERLRALDVRILGDGPTAQGPLRVRFTRLPRAAQGAVLRLDPLADREEYNVFLHSTEEGATAPTLGELLNRLRVGSPPEVALAQRVENLGFDVWTAWAFGEPSLSEVVAEGHQAVVADLSGFDDPAEPVAVGLDLVEDLWRRRGERTPTLLVIDEAHNLCPADPVTPAQRALVDRLVQIAAEGRKYGLWLLLSTQRPSKIHPQVLSQCDNLLMMRMNSPADVAQLAEVFGFVPPAMLQRAPSFLQGEAIAAGPLVPRPLALRMGDRLTVEGGSDVSVPQLPSTS